MRQRKGVEPARTAATSCPVLLRRRRRRRRTATAAPWCPCPLANGHRTALGLQGFLGPYRRFRNATRTAGCGPARPVVCGRRVESGAYPIESERGGGRAVVRCVTLCLVVSNQSKISSELPASARWRRVSQPRSLDRALTALPAFTGLLDGGPRKRLTGRTVPCPKSERFVSRCAVSRSSRPRLTVARLADRSRWRDPRPATLPGQQRIFVSAPALGPAA